MPIGGGPIPHFSFGALNSSRPAGRAHSIGQVESFEWSNFQPERSYTDEFPAKNVIWRCRPVWCQARQPFSPHRSRILAAPGRSGGRRRVRHAKKLNIPDFQPLSSNPPGAVAGFLKNRDQNSKSWLQSAKKAKWIKTSGAPKVPNQYWWPASTKNALPH